jgi:ribose/xylose/arabinose/galactoside ABC-type transport system permease subunit
VLGRTAGLILVSSDGGFDPTASADYLLPAQAAVCLGAAVALATVVRLRARTE